MSPGETRALDLSILNDHHKDTFAHIKGWEARRDRALFAIAALLGFLFLGVYYPATVKAVFAKSATVAGAEVDLASLPVEVLVSLGWAVLFALVLRHCQASITVDRQYGYLHLVEKKMSTASGDPELFQREGSAYLSGYPAFSWWAYVFYAGIFPMTVVLVSARLLTVECTSESERFYPLFDGFMWIGVVVSFSLYRLWPIMARKFGRNASTPSS